MAKKKTKATEVTATALTEKPIPTLAELEAEMAAMGGFEEERGTIVMLPIDKLYPHPNNPRKDLGELTELTASIKKNGVLQNLTVVSRETGGYTLIIGHRRCAAAKVAGLTELPCVIAELSEREQLGMMLAENMQRADISAIEQAETMQMMLDLGDTVESIAEKTGFTKRTVKDRLKLSKLDRKKLQKACDRQVTLAELLKVADLTDENERNAVLSKAGTSNFNNAYQAAKDKEEKQKKMTMMREHLSLWANKRVIGENSEGDIYRTFISSSDKIEKISEKLDAAMEQYNSYTPTWREDSYGFTIFSQMTAEEKENSEKIAKKNEMNDQIDAFWDRLKEIDKRHYEMRLDFVRENRLGTSAYTDVLLQEYLTRRIQNTYGDTTYIRKALDTGKSDEAAVKKIRGYKGRPEDLLFLMAYGEMRDSSDGYFTKRWDHGVWRIERKTNESLTAIYEFLCKYGYEMSDDEIDMREGRHEVYREYLAMMEEQ